MLHARASALSQGHDEAAGPMIRSSRASNHETADACTSTTLDERWYPPGARPSAMAPCTPDASLMAAARVLTFAAELPDNVYAEATAASSERPTKERKTDGQKERRKAAHEPQPQWSMQDAHQLEAVQQLEKDWQEELKQLEKDWQEEVGKGADISGWSFAPPDQVHEGENARRNRLLVALEEGPTTVTVELWRRGVGARGTVAEAQQVPARGSRQLVARGTVAEALG